MFIELSKSGNVTIFNQSKYVCIGVLDGIDDMIIEINDKEARDYKEERNYHVYYNKKNSTIRIVTAKKHKEMQKSDWKDPNLVYVGT